MNLVLDLNIFSVTAKNPIVTRITARAIALPHKSRVYDLNSSNKLMTARH